MEILLKGFFVIFIFNPLFRGLNYGEFRMVSSPFCLPKGFSLFCRWQSTRRRHSVPGGGRIVFAGDLYVKGWQLYKQGQTTAPLPSAGESPRRRNSDGKISMCNVRTIKYLQIKREIDKLLST